MLSGRRYREVRDDKVVGLLKPHVTGSILDVGCFNGAITKRLSDNAVGIDVVVPPQTHITVTPFDGRQIPFPDRSFDTVVCSFVLHHSQNPEALLTEMRRVGKRLVVFEDTFDHVMDRASVIASHWLAYLTIGIPFDRRGFRPSNVWRELFRNEGLKMVQDDRLPSLMPGFPYLRHDLYVLETA